MESGEEEALSDLEEDVPPPVPLSKPSSSSSSPPPASLVSSSASPPPAIASLLAELETERLAKKAAEAARAELVMRFKTYTQDASRQREEMVKQKEEQIQKLRDDLSNQLSEAMKQRDEISHQRDDAIKLKEEALRQRDDANKGKEFSRSEIEMAARLLVEGAEKITVRVNSIKSFPGNLPRSSQHTGVAAIAYGYTKRAEEIVEELAKLHEVALKSRGELRLQMEQHNYRMAIEVSKMEASIQTLKEEVSEKASELEKWKNLASDKEAKIVEIEQDFASKVSRLKKESGECKAESQGVKNKIEKMKGSILQISNIVSKGNEIVAKLDELTTQSSSSSNLLSRQSPLPIRADPEEGLQDCLIRLKELVEGYSKITIHLSEHRKIKEKEINNLEDSVAQLIKEKEEISGFLRNALANKQELSSLSENGTNKPAVISMASALENEVKILRQQVYELQQSLAASRGEVEHLRVALDRQGKEFSQRTSEIEELKEKQSLAQDQIENLNMDLAAAQEEIFQWKQAATKEADAGAAMLEEAVRCQEEVSSLKKQCEQLGRSLAESNNKLQSKEEMTMAAIAARNAAERSLRIADERAVQLRERVEELNRQFDALERVGDGGITSRLYNMCWPYEWLRGRPVFFQGNSATQPSAEMGELFEPLVDSNS